MSSQVARIVFCVLMFPLAVVCYCVTATTLDGRGISYLGGEEFLLTAAGIVTWAFVAIYWTLLWRKSVRWTLKRRLAPIIVALLGIGVGVIVWIAPFNYGDRDVHTILLGILIPSLWLIATVYFWHESLAERNARTGASGRATIICPNCSYNLTGLTEARCPECGTKFTLDQLLSAQPARDATEIE